MLAALALIFSYIEVIFPFYTGIPGVKLGLANLVVVVALYKMSPSYAITINVVRVLMAGLLFSGLFGMLYSLAGSICSFLIMYLCWRSGLFSVLGVSLAGGVFHNLGQLAVAAFAVSNARIFFYFPVLIFSGMAAGIIVGIGSWVLISHLPDQIFRRY
ncbi:MAG: Gx transporter family protein [Lachnospiraceae bacterium]|nr:Gx transporter family protein [Lachnospiraceae bacterium]MBQ3974325.1 Gx transporter family protein [Lachnospiraceae bacterium]MBQ4305048.1 Gx transporter family protein [Lachnospiraceae bacterium]MBQ5360089.1 Gx transporter family protein [Lachnospiraceae bacterium]